MATNSSSSPQSASAWNAANYPVGFSWVGRRLFRLIEIIRGVGAFSLITFGVALTKFDTATRVVHPLIYAQIYRAGVRLVPMITFLGVALGLVIIGQSISMLTRYGVQDLVGKVMVMVVVRELGPILAALVLLARAGTANVIDLGTARALGEIEALESLNIDPVHYLVVPRVLGMAISLVALTVYLVLTVLVSGYVFAFLQEVPLRPSEYVAQIAEALSWEDFVLLGLKTVFFGFIIALVTSYHGLAQPLRLEEVSSVTTRAVMLSIIGCVGLDALFIVIYLII